MTDTELLDWMGQQDGCALISDDNGHWVFTGEGFQNVVDGGPKDVQTTFFIEASQWKNSVREAIQAAKDE